MAEDTRYLPLQVETIALEGGDVLVGDGSTISDGEFEMQLQVETIALEGGDVLVGDGSTISDGEFEMQLEESGNVSSYESLANKPEIQGHVLVGNKTFEQLGLEETSNVDLLELYNSIVRS